MFEIMKETCIERKKSFCSLEIKNNDHLFRFRLDWFTKPTSMHL